MFQKENTRVVICFSNETTNSTHYANPLIWIALRFGVYNQTYHVTHYLTFKLRILLVSGSVKFYQKQMKFVEYTRRFGRLVSTNIAHSNRYMENY